MGSLYFEFVNVLADSGLSLKERILAILGSRDGSGVLQGSYALPDFLEWVVEL